jgi:hypothetical protein
METAGIQYLEVVSVLSFYCAVCLQLIQNKAISSRWFNVARELTASEDCVCVLQHWNLLLARRHFTECAGGEGAP